MSNFPPSSSRRSNACAVLFALLFPSLLTLVYFVLLAGLAAALQQTVYAIGKIIQFAFPLWWILAVRRRRLRWRRPGVRGLLEGAAFGASVFVAVLLLYHCWLKPAGWLAGAQEAIYQKVTGFGLDGLPQYVALGAFYSLGHSFLEEYYWRWFVFGQLRELVSVRMAILVSSLGFMAHHVLLLGTFFGWFSWATVLFSLAVGGGGMVWAWMYHRTGSLWGPWLSHLLVDAAIFAVGYDMVRGLFGG